MSNENLLVSGGDYASLRIKEDTCPRTDVVFNDHATVGNNQKAVLLSTLCKNSWQLFTVRRGERFDCDYYDAGYQTLVAGLRK